MKIKFDVGLKNEYQIAFVWNQIWGIAKFIVNGELIFKSKASCISEITQLLSGQYDNLKSVRKLLTNDNAIDLISRWELMVGDQKQHKIEIIKIRPEFFAGFRKHKFYVLVNDQEIKRGKMGSSLLLTHY